MLCGHTHHCSLGNMSKSTMYTTNGNTNTLWEFAPRSASLRFILWQSRNVNIIQQRLFCNQILNRIGLCQIIRTPGYIKRAALSCRNTERTPKSHLFTRQFEPLVKGLGTHVMHLQFMTTLLICACHSCQGVMLNNSDTPPQSFAKPCAA